MTAPADRSRPRALALGLLLLSAPAVCVAQSQPAPVDGTETQTLSPEETSAIERATTAKAALDATLAALKPRADEIRADPAVPEAEQSDRILALLDPHQAELEAFDQALALVVRLQSTREGVPPEKIELSVEIARQHLMAAFIQDFISGGVPPR